MTERRDMTPRDSRPPEEQLHARAQPDAEATEEALDVRHTEAIEVGPPPLTEADVRRWLDRLGRVAAWLIGRFASSPDLEPPAWRFTEEELGELTPPATRVFNRRLLWLAGVIRNADEIELGFLLLEYVDHNLERVREAREAEEAAADDLAARTEAEPGDPSRSPATFGLEGAEGPEIEPGGRLKGR